MEIKIIDIGDIANLDHIEFGKTEIKIAYREKALKLQHNYVPGDFLEIEELRSESKALNAIIILSHIRDDKVYSEAYLSNNGHLTTGILTVCNTKNIIGFASIKKRKEIENALKKKVFNGIVKLLHLIE